MTREKATSIVNKFFKDMNPTFWNGEGEKPSSFKEIPWQYPLTDEVNLEITFVCDDEDDWHHCCDLVCSSDNSSFDMLSGYGIDSPLNLIDTIEDLCRDYGEKKLPKVLFRHFDDMEHIVIFDNGFVKSDECEGFPKLTGLDVLKCLAKHGYIELEEEEIKD